MSVELPEVIRADAVEEWADRADVVIAGFGIAGACAAIAAAEAGANVLVVERASGAGGTTAMAAGHFYLGGGTPVQQATGFEDTPENMYAYLEAVTPVPDRAKLRLYCDSSVDHFAWLEAQGLEFERTFYPGKDVVQPGTEGLMWSGNEKVAPYRDLARPAPRGHKVAAAGDGGGAVAMATLTRRCEDVGVRAVYDTGVTGLVVDDARAVVGVTTHSFGDRATIAAGAVVLAAGGFVMNRDMVSAYTPRLARRFMALGSTHDDGLGIRLGMSAGGTAVHMEGAFVSAPFYPPASLLKGIIVNHAGERFVAEDSYHGRIAGRVLEQPDAAAYLIVGADDVEWPALGLVPFIDGWDTIPDMAARLGIPTDALQRTITEHDQHAANGKDPAFGKHPESLAPLGNGPYAAFDLTPGKATYVGFTLGGLRTSIDGEILTDSGNAISGLYAAGACASNIAQDCLGYSSGTCLGEASLFGRRAGMHAAQ